MDFHDAVSSASHLVTAAWAAFATLILVRLTRGHGVGRWAIGFYGLSMVLLYTASGLFHGWHYESPDERLLFQKLDKSAVFLLIAGTYVPVVVYLLSRRWRRWTFAALAGMAVFGIGSLWLAPDLPHEELVGVYVLMGLSGLLPIRQYAAVAGWANFKWVVRVVAPYFAGAVVEVAQRPVVLPGWLGPHELMHFATAAGSLAYFAFLVQFLTRRPPLADVPVLAPDPVWGPAASVPELTPSGFAPAGM
jgi:hemolysin III